MTALDEDIRIGRHGRCSVPHDRDQLIRWVKSPKNLDLVAEAFRRVCSGYVSTARLFAIQSPPLVYDWNANISMLRTAEDVLRNATISIDLFGGPVTASRVAVLEDALKKIAEVRESLIFDHVSDALPVDRAGVIAEFKKRTEASDDA